jgi:hypothetical protein
LDSSIKAQRETTLLTANVAPAIVAIKLIGISWRIESDDIPPLQEVHISNPFKPDLALAASSVDKVYV